MSRSHSKKAMAERAIESRAITCSAGRIITPPASEAYLKNYDRIFKKKSGYVLTGCKVIFDNKNYGVLYGNAKS
jgi:hypothetical protein